MGKLSAFWLTGIAASLAASAAAAAPVSADSGTMRLHALPQALQVAKGPMIQSQIAPFRMNAAQKANAGYGRMDNGLARVSAATSTVPREQLKGALESTFPNSRFINAVPLSAPLALVDMHVEPEHQAAAMQQLTALGAQHVSAYSNVVSAFIPSDRMKEASNVEGMRSMRLSMATTNTGKVSAQGDIIQSTYAIRAPYTTPGYTGAGYTVGVMSDSFACQNKPQVHQGYADDVASGDLPANVNVLEDAPGCAGTDEGRAMTQLVYDIAPGVNLAFHTAFAGEADFANGIRDLQKAGANIIVDDVFYFDEPVFQDGMIAKAVDNVHDAGAAYFSSAGNNARQSYEANWLDSGTQGIPGDDNQGEELMAFKTPAVPPLGFPLPPTILPVLTPFGGGVAYITLQWDQPFVSGAPGSPGASSVMNVCLVDIADPPPAFGHVYPGSCSGHNALGENPFVLTGVAGPALYGIEISLAGGSSPNLMKLTFLDDGLYTNPLPGYATYSPTSFGHAAAAGAAAVGASYFRANPLCNPDIYPTFTLEQFSSSGGDPILFDHKGLRKKTPELRQKPAFVAPDGDNTTFFSGHLGARTPAKVGCRNFAQSWNFFGTSSAAPHAAGMAALLWEAGPDQTNDMVVAAMEHSAVPQMLSSDWFTYNPGAAPSNDNPVAVLQTSVNYDTGWGFIQGYYALPYVLLQANPGTALFVPQGNTVTLDGSASSIPPDAKPTYVWTQVAGPKVTLANADSAHPSFPATETASYAFVLTVALDNGRVSPTSAPVAVTVTGGPGAGGGGAIGLGLLIPGFMAAALRRRRKA